MRVLVVEDDTGIADALVQGLRRERFEASSVKTGTEALAAAGEADMVLLDLGLPDIDGYALCRQLRDTSSIPIIVITARGAEADKVIGLELGADDYLVKPFGFRELLARIRAVQRRAEAPAVAARSGHAAVIGPLRIDRRTRRVTVGDRDVILSPKEYDLLVILAEDPGAVVTREKLLDQVWGAHWYGPTKTIDVHVASLRKKLGHPEWIETIRSVGLRLAVVGEATPPLP